MAEKSIEMRRKRADGGFDIYYPKSDAVKIKGIEIGDINHIEDGDLIIYNADEAKWVIDTTGIGKLYANGEEFVETSLSETHPGATFYKNSDHLHIRTAKSSADIRCEIAIQTEQVDLSTTSVMYVDWMNKDSYSMEGNSEYLHLCGAEFKIIDSSGRAIGYVSRDMGEMKNRVREIVSIDVSGIMGVYRICISAYFKMSGGSARPTKQSSLAVYRIWGA